MEQLKTAENKRFDRRHLRQKQTTFSFLAFFRSQLDESESEIKSKLHTLFCCCGGG
jgi:hypothetical protein